MGNSVVILILLAVVLAPFLGILYSVAISYNNAPAAPAAPTDASKH